MRYEQSFHIGLEETLAFQLHYARRTRYLLSSAMAVGGAILMFFLMRDQGTSTAIGLALLSGAFFFLLMLVSIKSTVKKQLQEQYDKGERKPYEQQITLDGFGLTIKSGKKAKRYDFDKLIRVDETGNYLFLYVKSDLAYTLSKAQMLQPEQDCTTVRQILRSLVVASRLHLKK